MTRHLQKGLRTSCCGDATTRLDLRVGVVPHGAGEPMLYACPAVHGDVVLSCARPLLLDQVTQLANQCAIEFQHHRVEVVLWMVSVGSLRGMGMLTSSANGGVSLRSMSVMACPAVNQGDTSWAMGVARVDSSYVQLGVSTAMLLLMTQLKHRSTVWRSRALAVK